MRCDLLKPAGDVCRPATLGCDVQETCSGDSAACPTDGFKPFGVVCRPVAPGADCDVQDVCTGTVPECRQVRKASGTVCRLDNNPCGNTELCTGESDYCPPDVLAPIGKPCAPDANGCTADQCNGFGSCVHPELHCPAGKTCAQSQCCLECDGRACCNSTRCVYDPRTERDVCG